MDSKPPKPVGKRYSRKSSTEVYRVKQDRIFCATFKDSIYQFSYRLFWCACKYRLQDAVRRSCNDFEFNLDGLLRNGGRVEPLLSRDDSIPHVAIILCVKWESTPKQLALLHHEVNHAVFTFMKKRCIMLPKNGDWKHNDEECFCYYSQWLFQQCLDALNNQFNKKYYYKFAEEKRIN